MQRIYAVVSINTSVLCSENNTAKMLVGDRVSMPLCLCALHTTVTETEAFLYFSPQSVVSVCLCFFLSFFSPSPP